jgi:hypothetical protein
MTIARTATPAEALRRLEPGLLRRSDRLPARLGLTEDEATFRDAVARLLVLHELKKSGALTFDEFNAVKARILDL